MKKLLFFSLFFCQSVYGQNFSITNELSIGGSSWDMLSVIPDGSGTGYFFYGSSNSSNTIDHMSPNYGNGDYWLVRTDLNYNILWEESYGGTGNDSSKDAVIYDNHIYLAGSSNSPISGNKTVNTNGGDDVWLLKLTLDGTVVWQKSIGGSGGESRVEIAQYLDQILLYTISSSSNSGDITTFNQGYTDCWVALLDPITGTINDQAMFGSTSAESMGSLEVFGNKIFIMTDSFGNDGDVPVFDSGSDDNIVIFELNADLDIIQTNGYGGNSIDSGLKLLKSETNAFFLIASSQSNISGDKTSDSFGNDDVWVLKLDSNFNVVWDFVYGGSNYDYATPFTHIDDNGSLVILSESASITGSGNKTSTLHGFSDLWLLVINPNTGAKTAEFSFGGNNTDGPTGMLPLGVGKLLLVAFTESDISGNKSVPVKGIADVWVIETDASDFLSISEIAKDSDFQFYPNPTNQSVTLSLNEGADYQKIQFLTVDGRILQTKEISHGAQEVYFDFSNMPTGVIIYKIVGSKGTQTGRLVKTR